MGLTARIRKVAQEFRQWLCAWICRSERVKPRAVIIMGAGASVEFGLPALKGFGASILARLRADDAAVRTGATEAYLQVRTALMEYYSDLQDPDRPDIAEEEAHFERIYHVLQELEALRVSPGAVSKFRPVMMPFLEQRLHFPPGPGPFGGNPALGAACDSVVKAIYATASEASAKPKISLDPLRRFFTSLESTYTPRIYTTNYDDFALQATDGYYTGFGPPKGAYGVFDRQGFWAAWDRPAIFHLHGSVHLGFPREHDSNLAMAGMAWFESRQDALQHAAYSGSGPARMDGTTYGHSAVITGLDKLNRLQESPFCYYHSAMAKDLVGATVILVLGNGLADRHLVTWLHEARVRNPKIPLLFVSKWQSHQELINKGRGPGELEIAMIHGLRVPLFEFSTGAKIIDGWLVHEPSASAVWVHGFQSFLDAPAAMSQVLAALDPS
jgi:hypothetical protein